LKKREQIRNSKGKLYPTTGQGGPRGSGQVKAPGFLNVRHYDFGSSSAIHTDRLYPKTNPWYSFSGTVSTPGHIVPSGGATGKIPSDTNGNRSCDFPTSSEVP